MNEPETSNPKFDTALAIVHADPARYGIPAVGEPIAERNGTVFTQQDFNDHSRAAAFELIRRAQRRAGRQHTGGSEIGF